MVFVNENAVVMVQALVVILVSVIDYRLPRTHAREFASKPA
jgi:hypothetical protein